MFTPYTYHDIQVRHSQDSSDDPIVCILSLPPQTTLVIQVIHVHQALLQLLANPVTLGYPSLQVRQLQAVLEVLVYQDLQFHPFHPAAHPCLQ